MNAMTEGWIRIGGVDDIPVRGARRVEVGTRTIAVFRTAADRVYALDDRCPHRGGPLSQGIVHGDCVTCPLHNWVMSLATGKAEGADEGETSVFPVRVETGVIYLALSPSAVSGV